MKELPPKAPAILSETPEGLDVRLMLQFMEQTGRPVIHVARDERRLEEVKNLFSFFSPETRIVEFPAWDCPPYSRISPNPRVKSKRIYTLGTSRGLRRKGGYVVLCTANSATQKIPPQYVFHNSHFRIELQQNVNPTKFQNYLTLMGFNNVSKVLEPGEFALRGGIIDVFPPGYGNPFRIDFFGDTVDGLRQFSPETQITVARRKRVDFFPVSEVILDEGSITRFRKNFRTQFGINQDDLSIYQSISAGILIQGIEHWLPFFYDKMELIFDYFPEAFVFVEEEVKQRISSRLEFINELYESRRANGSRTNHFEQNYYPCPPGNFFVDYKSLQKTIKAENRCIITPYKVPARTRVHSCGGKRVSSIKPERGLSKSSINNLPELIREELTKRNVLIACWTEGSLERIEEYLRDENITHIQKVDNFTNLRDSNNLLMIGVLKLAWGFTCDDLTVISEQDIFGPRKKIHYSKKKSTTNFLKEFGELLPGDLIVHRDHGVGKFLEIDKIITAGRNQDCIALEYSGGTKLYLPVENMDLLSKLGNNEARLDVIGGTAWQERKAKLKKDLLALAGDLVATSAKRKLESAPVLRYESKEWDLLLSKFPFMETADQEKAIADVLYDLESGKPMDRLICGDVGFGKTEVAIRAAFVTAMSGKQVAVVAPTTLLVRQHLAKFQERLQSFPLEISNLSRLVPQKSHPEVLSRLENGTTDIVIGTHALLGSKVKFENLGLLIIDEEQNFGVVQKEKLKKLKDGVHVLTLTATPIPRTLQLTISGARDISLIGTPPLDRIAIKTFVTEFDPIMVRQALLREKQRGGQSFLITPRIKDLEPLERFLEEQVPEITFTKAHGQMKPDELEKKVVHFYSGKTDAMLSTTIVASGLDIPSANTIIIYDAQKFGLAQLYQIRGRVGRSSVRAYAYITYPPNRKLTEGAVSRLRVFSSLNSLGAGFSLAAHDLDHRGAGNLLGEQQSGHIQEVGFELYLKMLQDAVENLERERGELKKKKSKNVISPKLNLGMEARIPEDYIKDLNTRLGIYRRLSDMEDEDLNSIAEEITDRFGSMPKEVKNFFILLNIKDLCINAGISNLDCSEKGASIKFFNNEFNNPDQLMRFLNTQGPGIRIFQDRIFIPKKWADEKTRIRGIQKLLKDLISLGEEKQAEVISSH
ncbi:MAG: transcription-repair coupling factor [Paracoccaceae bacterium]|nr:transcription-repair coupling factor [Paracoccaceae bacterium]MDE2675226.1 transcription-repair coupling factor [Paracoccaceae bacterium]